MFKKTLIAALTVLSLTATFAATGSAFAWCNDTYQPVRLDQGYGASDYADDYGYRGGAGVDRHQFDREHARFDFHDRRH